MVDVQPVPIPVIWTVFSVLCLYDFWTSYRNTNLHMHIEPPKNIIYNVILLAHLSTLHFSIQAQVVYPFVSFLDG